MLYFWGGLDRYIPPDQIAAVMEALRQARKPHVNVVISDADHGFFCNECSSYYYQTTKEAWALTRAFLREKLG